MKRVYFMRRIDGMGPVKIGCSSCPDSRLRLYADWSPYRLCIAADAPGGFGEENALHIHFGEHRLHGEWFAPNDELSALIEQVARTGHLTEAAENMRAKAMAARYIAGETLQQIGDAFGITRERVRQILRKNNVASLGYRDAHKKFPTSAAETRADTVLRLHKEGLSNAEIAERVGDYVWNVRNCLGRRGLHSEHKGRPFKPDTIERAKRAVTLYREGVPTALIARQIGVQQPSIYRLLRYEGVEPSRKPRLKRAA